MSLDSAEKVNRKYIRANPDPLDFALVAFDGSSSVEASFIPNVSALIYEESPKGGCCLIMHRTEQIQSGQITVVKLGRMNPLRAEVVWRRSLDPKLIKVGFKFLE